MNPYMYYIIYSCNCNIVIKNFAGKKGALVHTYAGKNGRKNCGENGGNKNGGNKFGGEKNGGKKNGGTNYGGIKMAENFGGNKNGGDKFCGKNRMH